ncbi:MAG TPA: hypothetical protein VHC19_04530 [Pirellulales bacterium]|nr:hypothetical protein [Pirellulales bacterium]
MKSLCMALTAVCLFASLGCGKAATNGRQPVSGKVTLQGAPLDSGSIQFMPPDPGGQFGGGAVITNGEYKISAQQGLPVGKYKVVISAGDASQPVAEGEMPGEAGPPAKERIPEEYNVKSDKVVEVAADKENVFDFDIP